MWKAIALALALGLSRPLAAQPAVSLRLEAPSVIELPRLPQARSGAALPATIMALPAAAPKAAAAPAGAMAPVQALALAANRAAKGPIKFSGNRAIFDGAADAFAAAEALAPVIVSVLTPDLRVGQWRKIPEPGPGGHCYAASEALYHMMGGKKAGWTPVVGRGIAMHGLPAGTHWFLRHNPTGRILDVTAAQFPGPYPYERGHGTGFLTKQPSKRAAEIIKRVKAVLKERDGAAQIHPERTAPTRGGASLPTRLALPMMKGDVLDYGAGRGEDVRFLKNKGFRVTGYDPYYFPAKPKDGKRFDWVTLNYVLNVIASPAEREGVLKDVSTRLKPGGRILVSVRGRPEIESLRAPSWKRRGDGWITSHQTFQHGYTPEELHARLAEQGLEIVQSLTPLIVVARKAEPASARFGKETPSAVYFHRSWEKSAPARLKALVERARPLLPKSARWNVIKVAHDGRAVSFLWYPEFDSDPHPALRYVYRVDPARKTLAEEDHRGRANPFILHRKDSLVPPNDSRYEAFRRVTEKEEAAGLLNRNDIGTREGWAKALRAARRRSS